MIECFYMQKSGLSLIAQILQKIAPKIGAKFVLEPKWKKAGQIIFKNGRVRYLRFFSLDLNTLAAAEISKDKDFSNFFLKRGKFPTIPGKAFFSNYWCKTIGSLENINTAYRYAVKLGFPVFVKPNSGSQGNGVTKVHNKFEFYKAVHAIFQDDHIVLVQKPVAGKDYRIVILDDKIISAYQRLPLNIIGDGKSSVYKLLKNKQKKFISTNRDTAINMSDIRIRQSLKHQGLSFRSIPPKNKTVYLLDNANLSTGGDPIDVTKIIHPDYKKIAISITKYMGLRLCGVDLMITGDIDRPLKKYWVLETNAAPGLDHYVKVGKAQEKIVEDMYLQVLKAMEK